ncbi:MAG: alpha/beta hydrolase, partial [Lachnospiraceae bacterium]|nr:alpha/beta hydrolase [Lachnospiraceae bacterium]
MPYALHFVQNYRFLIYEYPLHITNVDEQMAFTFALLKALAIRQVILIGCSDGGVHAQIFAKNYPEVVTKMILITTLTLDSDYLRHIKKAWFVTPLLLLFLKLIPAKTEINLLLKKCQGFLTCESPEGQAYGRTFYETVTSDLCYKQRYIR